MVQAVAGGAGGIFAATAKQFQAKAQAAFQKLQTGSTAGATSGVSATNASATGVSVSGSFAGGSAASGLAAFLDPQTARKLEAMKEETGTLVKKLSTGGDNAKEAAARKKEEAKQKLKMLKLQAQLAAASGDKKAAARIAKEAAQVAKELGQAVKERGGGGGDTGGATSQDGASPTATGTEAAAAVGSEAVSAPATATEGQAAATQASGTPSAEGQAAPADASNAAAAAPPVTPSADAAADKTATANADDAAGTKEGKDAAGQDFKQSIQDKRDAIIKEGAERKAEMEFQQDTRRVMDELRSIHRQMKALARKDGSAGTAAEMERAGRDMAEGDRMVSDAFGASIGTAGATAVPTLTSVDIRV